MTAPATPSGNLHKSRRRPRLWFGLSGLVIVIVILAALLIDVPFLWDHSTPTIDAADDASFGNGGLNFADVVVADLAQEEEYNGKLESVKGTGTLIPSAQIPLAFDTAGTVADVPVQVGQDVRAGDVLARLDTPGLDRAVTQAEIALRQAQIALEAGQEPPTEAQIQAAQDAVDQAQQALEAAEAALTSVELAVQQMTTSSNNALAQAVDQYNQAQATLDALLAGASPSAVENLELQVQAANLNLEAAQENLTNASLVAPFDGVVVFVPQTPTASVSGPASFEVLVELDGIGTMDATTAATLAALPDETSVDVIFVLDAVTDVMAMPASALVALLEGGYAVEKRSGPNQVHLVAVDIGSFGSNNMIAVTSDSLQPGDQVVVP